MKKSIFQKWVKIHGKLYKLITIIDEFDAASHKMKQNLVFIWKLSESDQNL